METPKKQVHKDAPCHLLLITCHMEGPEDLRHDLHMIYLIPILASPDLVPVSGL